jgi:adenylate cyclase
LTLGSLHQQGATPWAICTPFQDNSQYALYVSGRLVDQAGNPKPDQGYLTEYQKFIEILVGFIEATRRTLRLTRQNAVIREAWPTGVRKYLDNPDNLDELLRPRETEATVLFRDLRGHDRGAESGDGLTATWGEIQKLLDTIGAAITEKGGIVATSRSDAVIGFWGWPVRTDDQLDRAAEAALRISERLSGPAFQGACGMGLIEGRALTGLLGAQHMGIGIYGRVVDAARLLAEATRELGIGIVASADAAKKLVAADPNGTKRRLRGLGTVRPSGAKTPLPAFELASPFSAERDTWLKGEWHERLLEQWNEAVELFTRGRWADAQERLEATFADDPVARCFLRYMKRTSGAPPAGWTGDFDPLAADE